MISDSPVLSDTALRAAKTFAFTVASVKQERQGLSLNFNGNICGERSLPSETDFRETFRIQRNRWLSSRPRYVAGSRAKR
ncbi:hypothetical protein NDU88_005917 [Pleurodeles waltl]|uniref:Uncharacterized protein n=1 Tax=Pleurodeles waltl TaxID=8319 RepID=A0AAV7TVB6_PLEWA|nr:hypothetical protein NDU88_005917 [Pleurodeles waltl]